MITGSPAFQGDTPVAVALKQIREYPKAPREIVPKLSHPVEAAILKCLQKDPAKRFQSVGELDAALERAAKARASAHEALSAASLRNGGTGALNACPASA